MVLSKSGMRWAGLCLAAGACAPAQDAPVQPEGPAASTAVETAEAALNGVCPGTNVITDPEPFQWTYHPASGNTEAYYSGTMEMGVADLMVGGESLTTRAYRQAGGAYSIPGPTLHMAPGSKYVLSFHNTLPYEAPSPEHNVFKDPNISNIHTHGLHISGESPGDDVTRSFEGGFGGDFVDDIPADHMGGSFWYHAHHHGSTFLQVSGGAFGMIVVDDGADGLPAPVANMTERELVVAYLDPSAAGTGGDTLLSGTLSPTWTVNGKVAGNLCMPANEWQHWRVLLADRNAMEKTVGVTQNCELMLLARDGVWRTTAPKPLPTRDISITGASRADFAVRCSGDGSLTVNGNAVATIHVGADGDPTVHPFDDDGVSDWSAVRPDYLRDLRGETNLNLESVQMGARTVNGSKFDMGTPTFTLPANQTQSWSVNGAARHPFHLHVYHVQSQNCGGDFEDGEYYDVVASNCEIRFDLNAATSTPYAGRTIMHCHILEHEDQGAMGWLKVEGGEPAPTFPAGQDFSDYYELGGSTPFCGDGTCDAGEDRCSCADDCGAPPATETLCTDGLDLDCDGAIDCADADCSADPACATPDPEICDNGLDDDGDGDADCADADCVDAANCQPPSACNDNGVCEGGEDCLNCGGDCAGRTGGRPTNRFCCGDGVLADAEGDGTLCDGNY